MKLRQIMTNDVDVMRHSIISAKNKNTSAMETNDSEWNDVEAR